MEEVYIARNKDGWLCGYDVKTHRCIDVILATGDNIEIYKRNKSKWLGEIDPKYENQQ